MFDSFAQNDRALLVGSHGAAKFSLSSGLDLDALFGAGTDDALSEKRGKSLDPRSGWTRQGWYRKCADTRGKAVSTLPWAVYPEGADNDSEPLWQDDDVTVPDALKVLDGLPHALYLFEASLSLCGAFYAGKRLEGQGSRVPGSSFGRFAGLMYWSPNTVTPKIGPMGLERFDRQVGGRVIPVDPESVVWAWQPDPFVEMGAGSSDGNAAGQAAAALDALARFQARHLDSGLIKLTVLVDKRQSTPGVTTKKTPEQASQLRQVWARLLRRGTDVDGPPVLNNIEPHVIGEGLKDVANKEITAEQRQAVSTAFGIPWSILTSEAANFATAQVEERGFYLRTVIPQARIIERALNEHLFSEYGMTFRFEPERHEVMQAWELEKAEKIRLVCGGPVLSRNEGRALLGYEPDDRFEMDEVTTTAPGGDGQSVPVEMRAVTLKESLEERVARIVGGGW
jgi:hypothetical protein